MERSKSISVRSINKIKNLKRKIFEYEDEEPEYVNRRAVAICERYIEKYLATVTLYETDKEFSEKKKTDMSFEMNTKGMIGFACEHKEMSFTQNLTL